MFYAECLSEDLIRLPIWITFLPQEFVTESGFLPNIQSSSNPHSKVSSADVGANRHGVIGCPDWEFLVLLNALPHSCTTYAHTTGPEG